RNRLGHAGASECTAHSGRASGAAPASLATSNVSNRARPLLVTIGIKTATRFHYNAGCPAPLAGVRQPRPRQGWPRIPLSKRLHGEQNQSLQRIFHPGPEGPGAGQATTWHV